MKKTKAQQKKTKSPKALFNLRRQRATKANLAKGLAPKEAMLAAGYSPLYVQHQGYKAVKRPCIQSPFTDSCERIMAKRDMQFDQIVEPYFDALTAKLIVKSTQLGDAQEVDLPDYPLRMSAADRIVELFGGKPGRIELPSEPPKGLTIIIQKEAGAKVAVVVNPTGRTSIVPEGETKHPASPVVIKRSNGSNGPT